ncbi:MAG: metal-sensing transcriptional repressor [Clostridium sartagoforme]|nr:metal-sensing transcriptional repressor [Clostridium sartagoforme]
MDSIDGLEHTHISEDGQSFTHTHKDTKVHKHMHSHESTKDILNRLARAAGHLEFVRRMVKDERDCSEVLNQIAAVTSALNSVSRVILQEHIEECVTDAIQCGDRNVIEDLKKSLAKLIK